MAPTISSLFYHVQPLTYRVWKVVKVTEDDTVEYYVRFTDKGWKCTCIGNLYRRECKHILMVKEFLVTGKDTFEERLK